MDLVARLERPGDPITQFNYQEMPIRLPCHPGVLCQVQLTLYVPVYMRLSLVIQLPERLFSTLVWIPSGSVL